MTEIVDRIRKYRLAYYQANKERIRERMRLYRRANRPVINAQKRRYRTAEHAAEQAVKDSREPLAMLLAQRRKVFKYPEPTRPIPDNCECCGKPPGKRILSLDHDHSTGAFRGWLCNRCNLGIGLLGDNAETVRRALRYLTEQ